MEKVYNKECEGSETSWLIHLRKGGIKRLQVKMDSSKVTPQEKSNNKEKTNHDNQKKSNKNRTDKNFM